MSHSNIARSALRSCARPTRSTISTVSCRTLNLPSHERRSLHGQTLAAQSRPGTQTHARYLALLGGAAAVAGLVAHRTLGQPVALEEVSIPTSNAGKPAVDGSFTIDPSTSVQHPLLLSSLNTSLPLSLVGVGVRTVSFLRVKVYSAGFYMDKKALEESARTTKGWLPGTFHAKQLLAKSPKDVNAADYVPAGEALMESILSAPVNCAIRIVPTRNTDLAHLRDGFVRAISARQKLALKTMALGPEQSDAVSESITTFKNFFPNSSVAKGQELLLVRTFDGNLAVEYGGKTMGVLRDPWVAKEMMLAYFADGNVPSHALKESVAEGLDKIVNGRP